jgi:hypothetical protein
MLNYMKSPDFQTLKSEYGLSIFVDYKTRIVSVIGHNIGSDYKVNHFLFVYFALFGAFYQDVVANCIEALKAELAGHKQSSYAFPAHRHDRFLKLIPAFDRDIKGVEEKLGVRVTINKSMLVSGPAARLEQAKTQVTIFSDTTKSSVIFV